MGLPLEDERLLTVLYTIGIILLVALLFLYLWCSSSQKPIARTSVDAYSTQVDLDAQELEPKSAKQDRSILYESTDPEALLRSKEQEAWRKVEDDFERMQQEILRKYANEEELRRLQEEEARQRALIEAEYEPVIERYRKYRERGIRWLKYGDKRTGSLGLKVSQKRRKLKALVEQGEVTENSRAYNERARFPTFIQAVEAGGAADLCRLIRSDGVALPEEDQKLRKGDLIIKVTVPEGESYDREHAQALKKEKRPETYYGGTEWPTFHREFHLMRALGVLGGVFEGTTFTIWIIRDKTFVSKFELAIDEFAKAGGRFAKMDRFFDSPFAAGVQPPIPFPNPADFDPSILLKGEVTMQKRSEASASLVKESFKKLSSFSSSGVIDHDMLYGIQTNDAKSKEYIRQVFNRYDTNGNGQLDIDEMYQVHVAIARECGINPHTKEGIAADFNEADVNGDGQLEFDEFYFYLREQIVNATMAMDEEATRSRAQLRASGRTGMEMSGGSLQRSQSPRSDVDGSDQEGQSLLGPAK